MWPKDTIITSIANPNIFVDSDALYAANDIDDPLHKKSVKILQYLFPYKPVLTLSTNIIMEVATLISQRISKYKANEVLTEFRSGVYRIIHPDEDLILTAEEIFKSIRSKNVSYSDCISFAVMENYKIDWAFSFDIHFKKQGFRRVLVDGKL